MGAVRVVLAALASMPMGEPVAMGEAGLLLPDNDNDDDDDTAGFPNKEVQSIESE